MSEAAAVHNPFMLLLNPEFVLAAMEKSERLGQLNRQLCRPLDRPAPGTARGTEVERDDGPDEPAANDDRC